MKNIVKLFVVAFLASNFIACTSQPGKAPKLKNNMDSVSYLIGVWVASGPANVTDKADINLELVKKGMADVFAGNDSVFSQQDMQKVLSTFSMAQQEKQVSEQKKAGQEFLDKNKNKPGVITTPSGLQYKIVQEGTGKQPIETDRVKVDYVGHLADGTIFDSSKERGQPAEFVLNQVIKGWTEGLQLMKEGAKYELYIPAELAYGAQPMGDKIKPYSTLVFEVELLEVLPPLTEEEIQKQQQQMQMQQQIQQQMQQQQ
jgi:FKBP-type peptidyl-prolyl cis-trans isomerase